MSTTSPQPAPQPVSESCSCQSGSRSPSRSTCQPATAVTHFAGRAGDHNDRAMAASPRLADALARRLGTAPTVIGSPQPARPATWDVELDAAREDLAAMREHYQRLLRQGAAPVAASSRCAVALATVPAVVQHHPDAVVVWFDAHADITTPATTTTSYLGGLALAGPLGLWDSGLGGGLEPGRTILVGTRDIDPPEAELVESTALTLVAPGPGLAERLSQAVDGRPVYVHIDCDVLEPGTVPTDYHVPGGLTLSDLGAAAAALARGAVVGLEVAELETLTQDEDLTPLMEALEPLLAALGRATAAPPR